MLEEEHFLNILAFSKNSSIFFPYPPCPQVEVAGLAGPTSHDLPTLIAILIYHIYGGNGCFHCYLHLHHDGHSVPGK